MCPLTTFCPLKHNMNCLSGKVVTTFIFFFHLWVDGDIERTCKETYTLTIRSPSSPVCVQQFIVLNVRKSSYACCALIMACGTLQLPLFIWRPSVPREWTDHELCFTLIIFQGHQHLFYGFQISPMFLLKLQCIDSLTVMKCVSVLGPPTTQLSFSYELHLQVQTKLLLCTYTFHKVGCWQQWTYSKDLADVQLGHKIRLNGGESVVLGT